MFQAYIASIQDEVKIVNIWNHSLDYFAGSLVFFCRFAEQSLKSLRVKKYVQDNYLISIDSICPIISFCHVSYTHWRPCKIFEEICEADCHHCSNNCMQSQSSWKSSWPNKETRYKTIKGCGNTINNGVENWAEEADSVPQGELVEPLRIFRRCVPKWTLFRHHHLERSLQNNLTEYIAMSYDVPLC